MKNLVFTMLIAMITTLTAIGQNTRWSGVLLDAQTQKPIYHASLINTSTNEVYFTDWDGHFSVQAAADDLLEVHHISYQTVKVKASETAHINLQPKKISLDEILVKASPLDDIATSEVIVDQVKKGSQVANVAGLFNDIPGFSMQKRSATASEPSFRAFKYEQMNIKYDGGGKMVHACPNRMDPVTAHVIPEEVRKIEIIKGPFSVRFGQSFGGIINIITKPPTPEKYGFHGVVETGYETNGSNFLAGGKLQYAQKKFDLTVNGESRNFGNYTDGNGTITPSSFKTNSYSIKLGINPTDRQRLQVDWRQKHGRDILHAGLPMDSPLDDSYMINLDYKVMGLTPKIPSLTFKTYYSDVDHLMTNGYLLPTPRPNFKKVDARSPVHSNTIGGKLELNILPTKKMNLYAGVDADIIQRDGNKNVIIHVNPAGVPLDPPKKKQFSIWQDALTTDYGLFAEANYQLTQKISTSAGIRSDFVSSQIDAPDPGFLAIYGDQIEASNQTVYSGHLAAKYRYQGLQIQLALGRGTRTPTMIERYIYRFTIGSDPRSYIGNPNLKPEINNQLEFSVRKHWHQHQIGFSTFYSKMQDYISAVVNSDLAMGNQPAPKQFKNVTANQYGFDIFLKYHILTGLDFTGDLAYTKATNETLNEPLAQVAPMSGHLGLKYETSKYWLDLRTRMVATQKDFSPSFAETETPGHTTIDFRTGYKIKGFTVGAAALNILNETYYNHLNFSYKNANEHQGKVFEPGRSFSLFAKFEF